MSKYWSIEDIAYLKKMLAQGVPQREMAKALGRSNSAIYYQVHRDRFRKRNRTAYKEYRSLRASLNMVNKTDVPPHLWVERDARLMENRTTTQELMGDPVPSRSALVSAKTES